MEGGKGNLNKRQIYKIFQLQALMYAKLDSNLKCKEGLNTVGSIQTVQAVTPDGPSLSPEKKSDLYNCKMQ